jgi:hypothetical protein
LQRSQPLRLRGAGSPSGDRFGCGRGHPAWAKIIDEWCQHQG